MRNKEIVDAICTHHLYEYIMVDYDLKVLQTSDNIHKYCEIQEEVAGLFEYVPELIGMETSLEEIIENKITNFVVPMVFKAPESYVNIRIQKGKHSEIIIILFENITEITKSQRNLRQVNNENMLLVKEIADKNRQLKQFNNEMYRLVKEEMAKNVEKQHMLELQTRHAQMGEMISMITHQWKQPLSVIQTVGTLLKIKVESNAYTPELFTEKIDNIINQAKHMNDTVKDFQYFFTPSKEKVVFPVKETISSLLGLIQMEYRLENIDIILEGNDEALINGYANEYNQVILSILTNAKDAFHATPHAHMKIILKVEKRENQTLLSIEDNAGGIPDELVDSLFSQYVTTKKNGSGLGLHIAQRVVTDNMGGKIWTENREDGAVFYILI
jgi:signal transduction histidine kinase